MARGVLGAPITVNARSAKDLEEMGRLVDVLADRIDRRLARLERLLVSHAYTLTGAVTEQRTLDAAAGTAADVRNVLATFIFDLQNERKVRGG